jgi:hypothetical protein
MLAAKLRDRGAGICLLQDGEDLAAGRSEVFIAELSKN